ncbi:MAG: hypothetical protein JW726_15350 [Anaerolineales bacterium]|nr:hypothetical protein [Anaerolineales bacterium]
MSAKPIFITAAATGEEMALRLLINSLRTFGGEFSDAPVWIFAVHPDDARGMENEQTSILPLEIPGSVAAYPFGKKVAACARAEELAPLGTRSFAWIDLSCLVVQPPLLFDLGKAFDAAFRPVHIRNVGLPPSEALDAFWRGIYAAVGVEDILTTVTSFVDSQVLRAYFNTHTFAFNPRLGLMRRWYTLFQQLVGDAQFQAAACQDERHQIFLFQALLSAIIASSLEPERVHILPPTYNYPYNLHRRLPEDHRPSALNDLVCFTFEERTIHPDAVSDIQIHEPLHTWLKKQLSSPA